MESCWGLKLAITAETGNGTTVIGLPGASSNRPEPSFRSTVTRLVL
jgi:hypothetical protein